ncbi:hypothetical protein DL96DRAFT_1739489 [Flagelloscypha sp. PMI_526]|nr:hypothetical protein DL96DRAFT_1739489 [Flagelloscypha sp. PMI_526]
MALFRMVENLKKLHCQRVERTAFPSFPQNAMLHSQFSLVALLSYFTLISSLALEARNSWRFSHGLPPARPRRFHSSATETAHRRSTSSIPLMVDGGDFESSSLWTKSSYASVDFVTGYAHTGNGYGVLIGSTTIRSLTSSITGLTPNSVYTLSYWIRVISGSTAPCTISALVGGIPGPGISQSFSGSAPGSNTWVQLTGQFTATAATASIVLQDKCTSQSNIVLVDDVTIAAYI